MAASCSSFRRSATPSPVLALRGTICWKSYASFSTAIIGMSCSLSFSRSILLSTATAGRSSFLNCSMRSISAWVSFSHGSEASVTSTARSTSETEDPTCRTMYSPRELRARCRPGVSMNTSWVAPSVSTPVMRVRVVCGRGDTMATFSPSRAFSRLLLPTLGRPTIAINSDFCTSLMRFSSLHIGIVAGQPQPAQRLLFLFPHNGLFQAAVHMVVAQQVQHGVHR